MEGPANGSQIQECDSPVTRARELSNLMDSNSPKSASRGGNMYSPARIGQMVIATVLLVASSVLLINELFIAAWVAMVLGMVLSFLQFR